MGRHAMAVVGLAAAIAMPAFAQKTGACSGPQEACPQIEVLGAQFDAAFGKDAATAAALFASQAMIMVPGPALSGRKAIEDGYRAVFAKGWSGHVFTFDQVHITGDTAWAVGSWRAN